MVQSDTTVVGPNILFVYSQRGHILTSEKIRGAPDLVVEILDPPTDESGRTFNLDLDVLRRVKEYWILDSHARTVMVLLRGESGFEVSRIYGEGQAFRSPMLERFSAALEKLL